MAVRHALLLCPALLPLSGCMTNPHTSVSARAAPSLPPHYPATREDALVDECRGTPVAGPCRRIEELADQLSFAEWALGRASAPAR